MITLDTPSAHLNFAQSTERLEQALLNHESGIGRDDADQRFFASYLLGHLSLASAAGGDTLSELETRVSASLHNAFAVDHLTEQDKSAIRALWLSLLSELKD